jgi:hypothetical protein
MKTAMYAAAPTEKAAKSEEANRPTMTVSTVVNRSTAAWPTNTGQDRETIRERLLRLLGREEIMWTGGSDARAGQICF